MFVSEIEREIVNKVQNDTDILQIEMQLAVLRLCEHEPQHVCVANAEQIVAIDRKLRPGLARRHHFTRLIQIWSGRVALVCRAG